MSLYFVHISQYQTQVLTGAVCFGSITFGTAAFESLLKKIAICNVFLEMLLFLALNNCEYYYTDQAIFTVWHHIPNWRLQPSL